jgi:hypothetical protein
MGWMPREKRIEAFMQQINANPELVGNSTGTALQSSGSEKSGPAAGLQRYYLLLFICVRYNLLSVFAY